MNTIIQSIIEHKYPWVTRWGVLVLFMLAALLALFLSGSFFRISISIKGRLTASGNLPITFTPVKNTEIKKLFSQNKIQQVILIVEGHKQQATIVDNGTDFLLTPTAMYPLASVNCVLEFSIDFHSLLKLLT